MIINNPKAIPISVAFILLLVYFLWIFMWHVKGIYFNRIPHLVLKDVCHPTGMRWKRSVSGLLHLLPRIPINSSPSFHSCLNISTGLALIFQQSLPMVCNIVWKRYSFKGKASIIAWTSDGCILSFVGILHTREAAHNPSGWQVEVVFGSL